MASFLALTSGARGVMGWMYYKISVDAARGAFHLPSNSGKSSLDVIMVHTFFKLSTGKSLGIFGTLKR